MKHVIFGVALLCSAVVTFSTTASAANTYKTNPAGLAYRYSTGVSAYGKPGGMVIAGNCNSDEAAFVNARANGAELIRYIAPVNVIMYQTCPEDVALYGNYSSTPKWPYPSAGARTNFLDTKMTDIRKGSVWSNKVVAYVENLMRENKVDGVFLDVVARACGPRSPSGTPGRSGSVMPGPTATSTWCAGWTPAAAPSTRGSSS
ncbi:MAG: hypothetical protein HC872_08220 [Gammaproteobacteria bacterium]|nr:hypothetical protein [Gammaproteobacteria bacterium]